MLNENTPWMTIMMCLLAVLFAAVGGVVAIANPETLSFDTYLDRLGQAALAVAGQGAGRALRKGLESKPAAGMSPGAADFAAHPDHPANDISLGVAMPEPAAGVNGDSGYVAADDLGLGAPVGAVDDEDMGADSEPGVGALDVADLGGAEDDGGLDGLPSDEEEFAAPPPPDDVDALDEPGDPAVVQPSHMSQMSQEEVL